MLPIFFLQFVANYITDLKIGIKGFLMFGIGYFWGAVSFTQWVTSNSNVSLFVKQFIIIPSSVCYSRLNIGDIRQLYVTLLDRLEIEVRFIAFSELLISVFVLIRFIYHFQKLNEKHRQHLRP